METEYSVYLENRGTPIVFRVLTANVSSTNSALGLTTGRIGIATVSPTGNVNFDGTIKRSWQTKLLPDA